MYDVQKIRQPHRELKHIVIASFKKRSISLFLYFFIYLFIYLFIYFSFFFCVVIHTICSLTCFGMSLNLLNIIPAFIVSYYIALSIQ